MARTPKEVLASLVADIEAMQHGRNIYEMGFSDGETNDHQPRDFFGPFTTYFDEGMGDEGIDAGLVEGGNGVAVEWPNLRILLDEAKQVLK